MTMQPFFNFPDVGWTKTRACPCWVTAPEQGVEDAAVLPRLGQHFGRERCWLSSSHGAELSRFTGLWKILARSKAGLSTSEVKQHARISVWAQWEEELSWGRRPRLRHRELSARTRSPPLLAPPTKADVFLLLTFHNSFCQGLPVCYWASCSFSLIQILFCSSAPAPFCFLAKEAPWKRKHLPYLNGKAGPCPH